MTMSQAQAVNPGNTKFLINAMADNKISSQLDGSCIFVRYRQSLLPIAEVFITFNPGEFRLQAAASKKFIIEFFKNIETIVLSPKTVSRSG